MTKPVFFPEKPPDFSETCSVRTILHYKFIPIGYEKEKLQLVVSDQCGFSQKEELRFLFREKEVEFVLFPLTAIEKVLYGWYGVGAAAIESLSAQRKVEQFEESRRVEFKTEDVSDEKRVSYIVGDMIRDAIRLSASDIHLEPFGDSFKIRYRIDGVLQEAKISEEVFVLATALTSRIKILAKLDLAEKRLPQDGRISGEMVNAENIDLRVSTLPTIHGESVVIRILRKNKCFQLSELGLEGVDEVKIRNFMLRPQGLFLVSGPTGSGKSTTLYAMIQTINFGQRKMMTVEDPVEYQLEGVIQTQVNSKIEWTFSRALRAMLRQDPDAFMIGEIRDSETAEIAVRAALTGHLVLATIHTKDAPSVITRLLDMGIEPHLLADALEGVLAQRLARRVCLQCSKDNPNSVCSNCQGSGYSGRMMVYELMEIDEELRALIAGKASALQIRENAGLKGMRTLSRSGESKIIAGLTTEDELKRIL